MLNIKFQHSVLFFCYWCYVMLSYASCCCSSGPRVFIQLASVCLRCCLVSSRSLAVVLLVVVVLLVQVVLTEVVVVVADTGVLFYFYFLPGTLKLELELRDSNMERPTDRQTEVSRDWNCCVVLGCYFKTALVSLLLLLLLGHEQDIKKKKQKNRRLREGEGRRETRRKRKQYCVLFIALFAAFCSWLGGSFVPGTLLLLFFIFPFFLLLLFLPLALWSVSVSVSVSVVVFVSVSL